MDTGLIVYIIGIIVAIPLLIWVKIKKEDLLLYEIPDLLFVSLFSWLIIVIVLIVHTAMNTENTVIVKKRKKKHEK